MTTETTLGIFIEQGADFSQVFDYPDALPGDVATAQMVRWADGPLLAVFLATVDTSAKKVTLYLSAVTTGGLRRSGVYQIAIQHGSSTKIIYVGPATLRPGAATADSSPPTNPTSYATTTSLTAETERAELAETALQTSIGTVTTGFVFSQGVAMASWSIHHGLNKYPSVTVVDSGNSTVEGEVAYVDANNVILTFSGAFSGKAYLN